VGIGLRVPVEELRGQVKHILLPKNTTLTSDGTLGFSFDFARTLNFILDITSVSGTSPTLDIYLDYYDEASEKWINQDKFPQYTATLAEPVGLSIPVRNSRYRARWVLGGTNPVFVVSLSVSKIRG